MNDTQILDNVLEWMKSWVVDMQPAAPVHLRAEIEWAERRRAEQRHVQHFWRCEHHPSAIDNYFDTELRGGCDVCKPQTS